MNVGDSDSAQPILSEHAARMVRRLPPHGAPVVPGSTPVVAFGDPQRAEVATLGINPSRVEFARDGVILTGDDRRLATIESLGATQLDSLTDDQVLVVLRDCANYFDRRPYGLWFNPLDRLIKTATGCSYYDRSACHLDLVQWATDPVWGDITDRGMRRTLLDDGVPHLRAQLEHDNVRLVLLNGRSVLKQVVETGLATLEEVDSLARNPYPCRLYYGESRGVRWVGWSTNLQSSPGVSNEFKARLAASVAELCQDRRPDTATTGDGFIPRGSRVGSKEELAKLLDAWLRSSDAATIGDVGSFGGSPWVHVALEVHEVVLNADTKRHAVERFVHDLPGQPQPWMVIANRRGRINKVLPYPAAAPLAGWYAYLRQPLADEGTI